jgi:hypothetical protein
MLIREAPQEEALHTFHQLTVNKKDSNYQQEETILLIRELIIQRLLNANSASIERKYQQTNKKVKLNKNHLSSKGKLRIMLPRIRSHSCRILSL